jgi:hypothetical protein
VLLHPFSVMVLLCVGVIIAGSTYQGFAATLNVTATVPAPLPTAAAQITSPSADLHTLAPVFNVTGNCPPQSYVKLYRNGSFSGVDQCHQQTLRFQIQTGLSPGVNQLQAKVFNVTDQEGPASPAVTLHYDYIDPTPPANPGNPGNPGQNPTGNGNGDDNGNASPSTVPTSLHVDTVDRRSTDSSSATSNRPTVRGTAPPFSAIEVTFHSDPVVCKTQADSAGDWSCTLQTALPDGWHSVDIVAVTPSGERIVNPSFRIMVQQSVPNLLAPAPSNPPVIVTGYTYRAYRPGEAFSWDVSLRQGQPPYKLQVDWGDNSRSTYAVDSHLPVTVSHTFPTKTTADEYVIILNATDAKGAAAPAVQLSAVVKGTDPVGGAVTGSGPVSGLLNAIRDHLWIVWPTYIVVVLMVLSYWLGEREVYQRFMKRRRLSHHGGKGHGR